MIGPSLRVLALCQRTALRRSLRTASLAQPKSAILLQLCNWDRNVNRLSVRCINTTKKNKDQHIEIFDPDYVDTKKPSGPKTAKEFADVGSQKNWISYGFDFVDPKHDAHLFHVGMFTMVTICCIVVSFIFIYVPDFLLRDWALREAYMQLDRRERLGLPLVDPNLVDPSTIELPSEEELGDFKIRL